MQLRRSHLHPVAVLVSAFASFATPISGQQLALQRDYPGPGPYECPALPSPAEPTSDQLSRARELGSDALQATLLGDLEGARTLLGQATEADPTSPDLAYQHARALEDLDLADAAIQEYCRAIGLGAVDAGILDARDRLDALYEVIRERISDRALSAFVSGLREADALMYEDAAQSFGTAIEESPDWAAAVYNRAVVLEQLGRIRESLNDYRRYLALNPDQVNPAVSGVSERIGMLEGEVSRPTPSPGNTLALGVLFPGMGQYYSGRSRAGTVVLSAAAAAVVTGFVVKKVTVRCLVPADSTGACPQDQVVGESTSHPYLVPALAATGGVMLVAAVEAFVKAKRRRAEQAETEGEAASSRIRIVPPTVTTSGNRTNFNLLQFRFR